ncbi:hypothetical protein PINS_up010530 [Pythium insidiosum]|nr:hypothetical protein PINS_up010530 [Pythium insidiosum]
MTRYQWDALLSTKQERQATLWFADSFLDADESDKRILPTCSEHSESTIWQTPITNQFLAFGTEASRELLAPPQELFRLHMDVCVGTTD